MLQANWLRSKAVAISWLMIMNILFVLPGSAIPQNNWLNDLQVDKWVHIALFAALVFLWCAAFEFWNRKKWLVLLAAFGYGMLVEFVQKNWVPNRSFDMYDVMADVAGSILGLVVWLRVNKKLGMVEKNKPL